RGAGPVVVLEPESDHWSHWGGRRISFWNAPAHVPQRVFAFHESNDRAGTFPGADLRVYRTAGFDCATGHCSDLRERARYLCVSGIRPGLDCLAVETGGGVAS